MQYMSTSARSSKIIGELFERVLDSMFGRQNRIDEEKDKECKLELLMMDSGLAMTLEEKAPKHRDQGEKRR